jgi:hypothetical protein
MLMLNGENDSTPVRQAILLQQRLTDVKHSDHSLITYPNLGHAFYPSSQWQREGSDFPGDHPFDENPLIGEPDKPGRLGLSNIDNGNRGELLCGLADQDEGDDVKC